MKTNRLLIVANPKSIHTQRLKQFYEDNFQVELLAEGKDFGIKSFFSALTYLRKTISEIKPDVIVLYQLNLTAFVAILANKKYGIPVFSIGIGSDILTMPHRGVFYKKMLKYILKHSQAFNAGSPYLLSEMKKYCPKNSEILLANLGIKPITATEKQNIIYSNRLHSPLYRIDYIIKAFANFVSKPQFADWKLIVAATGREIEFQQIAENLNIKDKVEFVGWISQEENAKYYAKSKIYISIPTSDSFPISLMEAMSAECLCVISDLPAYKGIMKNGENCLMVTDKEIQNLDYIENVLKLDSKDILNSNKTFVENYASLSKNKEKFNQIIKNLISEK